MRRMPRCTIKGCLKNSDFFVRARKRRAENRSVYRIHEDLSTALTLLSRKRCIFRGTLKSENGFGERFFALMKNFPTIVVECLFLDKGCFFNTFVERLGGF